MNVLVALAWAGALSVVAGLLLIVASVVVEAPRRRVSRRRMPRHRTGTTTVFRLSLRLALEASAQRPRTA